jgi:glycosyltransferase involved in cell wall biosynthesis
MKVLFVTREYPPFEVGGVAVHTFNLVKHLTELGVSCKVISFGDEKFSSEDVTFVNPSSSIIDRGDASVALDARIPADIVRFSRIAKNVVKSQKFDVIHVEEPYVGALIRQTSSQVKVTTFHDTSYGEVKAILGHSFSSSSFKRTFFYSSLGFYLELMSIASSGTLIVPTSQIRDELLKIYKSQIGKIAIIRNGVNIPKLDKVNDAAKAKQKLGLDPNSILIFSIARMVSRKRLDLLVNAVKILEHEGLRNYNVVIAGDGPDRSNVMQCVLKNKLNDLIKLPGWISDEQKNLFYRAADIFVLTSNYEGFPFTMLEAMSYGNAIVNSKIDGLNLLRDGLDGLLFPAGDYRALSNCIKKLIMDASFRGQLSKSARLFSEKHSWKNVAQETKNLYQKLI